jgi:hypothetical protein
MDFVGLHPATLGLRISRSGPSAVSLRPRRLPNDKRLDISLGFRCPSDDPWSGRSVHRAAEQAPGHFARTPLVGFMPLRRLRTGSPEYAGLPPPASVPPMPIHTASTTYASIIPSRFHPGNDHGVRGDLQGSSLHADRSASPLHIPSWRWLRRLPSCMQHSIRRILAFRGLFPARVRNRRPKSGSEPLLIFDTASEHATPKRRVFGPRPCCAETPHRHTVPGSRSQDDQVPCDCRRRVGIGPLQGLPLKHRRFSSPKARSARLPRPLDVHHRRICEQI